jgi:hypothetical protein
VCNPMRYLEVRVSHGRLKAAVQTIVKAARHPPITALVCRMLRRSAVLHPTFLVMQEQSSGARKA